LSGKTDRAFPLRGRPISVFGLADPFVNASSQAGVRAGEHRVAAGAAWLPEKNGDRAGIESPTPRAHVGRHRVGG